MMNKVINIDFTGTYNNLKPLFINHVKMAII